MYIHVQVCMDVHIPTGKYYILTLSPSYPQGGETALHRASHVGQTAVVRVLLNIGADVHAVDHVVGVMCCVVE